ncbi:hypothetical protein G7Y89_g15619 [Cudoniella acicularis]|uniref:Helicase C-terminal domain-containing protein n=1 Tax=Cudoniella acicularis TaxID=354080 RepID=A0A8H4QI77_9HELO|nr:hypothetical protein G7Y89_g15619 [Cudoniella acicularis]
MSATLNNAELLAGWLGDAKFYISRYRPVPVEEHLVFDNNIYPASTSSSFYKTATQLTIDSRFVSSQAKPEPVRTIQPSKAKEFSNPLINAVVSLANETARAGYGALVFCSSRSGSESAAILISQVLPRPEEIDPSVMDKRTELLNDLRSTSTELDHVLEKTVPVGVAFHHAGLTAEERDFIAAAYDQGTIKVIVATCSLAAGINLPARRVILYGARMGPEFVGPSMLCEAELDEKEKTRLERRIFAVRRAILKRSQSLWRRIFPTSRVVCYQKSGASTEVIATKPATSDESVDDYMKKTLLYHSIDQQKLANMTRSTLDSLAEQGLVRSILGNYEATLLGQAVVASSLTPEDGLFVHRELSRALQAFVMDGDMHALYTFTPVHSSPQQIHWQIFRREMEGLDEANLRVVTLVGLKPSVINKMAQGGSMKEMSPEEIETARIYKRFYSALQLRDICNEMPIYAVARKYDIPRGVVQNLAQTCHGFAAGMIKFCQRMDWGGLAAVLDHYSDRLRAGAKSDLLALAQIMYVKSRTARIFWENGFKTVAAVASADPKELLPVLLLAQPRKPKLESKKTEDNYLEKLQKKAEIISQSANKIWERQLHAELDVDDEE